MPSKSKAQQRAAGMAHAAAKGALPVRRLHGAARQMFQSMRGTKALRKFAATPHKGLPDRVGESQARRLLRERDDAQSLPLGRAGHAYARMDRRDVEDQPGGTARKWHKSMALRREVTNQKHVKGFPSRDAAGKVPHAIKEAQAVVFRLLAVLAVFAGLAALPQPFIVSAQFGGWW